jgi:hypothetical protein
MRKPTRDDMRKARAVLPCPDCHVPRGTPCLHPSNNNTKTSSVPDHVGRFYLWASIDAPELPEADALALLGADCPGLGWYLQSGIVLRASGPHSLPTLAVYLEGSPQRERLRVLIAERGVNAGWLICNSNGRPEYRPTARGVLAAAIYSHMHGIQWQRIPPPPPQRKLTEKQRVARRDWYGARDGGGNWAFGGPVPRARGR